VRRVWSAAYAWQVEAEDRRTGEWLLLLSEDPFDARLTEVRPPRLGEITTAQTTVHAAHTKARGRHIQ